MDKQVPNFSSFVGFVFQEEKTFSDRLGAIPAYFMSLFGDSSSSNPGKSTKEPVRVQAPIVKEEVVPYTGGHLKLTQLLFFFLNIILFCAIFSQLPIQSSVSC